MAQQLAKSSFFFLALVLLTLTCRASQSDDDEFNLLDQQVHKLFEQGKYQEAIPLAEKAVELAKRVSEQPNTAQSLNDLAVLYQDMHEYAKAEPPYQEALRIRQKVLGSEDPRTGNELRYL